MTVQFGFQGFLRFLYRQDSKKVGREKLPAIRGYGNLKMINPARRFEYCPTMIHFSGKELSCGETLMA
jgi:hypothetical protein